MFDEPLLIIDFITRFLDLFIYDMFQKAHRKGKGKRGGRPVIYDSEAYKSHNVVQCSSNALNQGSLATRYDKLALTYRSSVTLQSLLIWSAAIAAPGDKS